MSPHRDSGLIPQAGYPIRKAEVQGKIRWLLCMADNPAKDESVLFCPTVAAVLGRRRDAALIFVTFYQEKVKKDKPAGALDKIQRFK
ncbi:MAG: hypothetical protein QM668_23140 [Agriterribacter sp.]